MADVDEPGHAARPPGWPRRWVAAAGLAAIVIAALVAVPALLRPPPDRAPRALTTIEQITVDPLAIPLSATEILALLDRPADLGPLSDPRRRSACLAALGYPGGSAIRGARELTIAGRPAVLLLLDGEEPGRYAAIAVAPSCNAADSGQLTQTALRRP